MEMYFVSRGEAREGQGIFQDVNALAPVNHLWLYLVCYFIEMLARSSIMNKSTCNSTFFYLFLKYVDSFMNFTDYVSYKVITAVDISVQTF